MSRVIRWMIVLAVLGGAGWYGWQYWQARSETPTTYQTEPVQRGTITQTVTASGALNPVVKVTIGSQVSGRIKTLNADFNSPVKQGEVIAEIDPRSFQAAFTQATGNLANARATLKLAQITFKRNEELRAQNAIPQSLLDTTQADLEKAEASVKIQQGSLDVASANLSYCKIASPVDGIVISRSVDVGQTVAASLSAPELFSIANDLTKMQIDANVAEADVGNVKDRQAVDFTVDAFPYDTFHGTVQQVRNAATTTNNVVTYDVVIEVSNPELKLRPGMTANVSIIVEQHANVLTVGNAALRVKIPELEAAAPSTPGASPSETAAVAIAAGPREQRGQRRGQGGGARQRGENSESPRTRILYVLPTAADTPVAKTVKTGITNGIVTEIADGLAENEAVVTAVFGGDADNAGKQPGKSNNPFMPSQQGRPGGGGRR